MKHQELKALEKAEGAAWRKKMACKEVALISTEYGKEGALELAWRKAADACAAYRGANGLMGLSWRQIEARG